MSDELPPFEAFESIARLSRNCVISEKIDGTNAQVCVLEDGRVLAVGLTTFVRRAATSSRYCFKASSRRP